VLFRGSFDLVSINKGSGYLKKGVDEKMSFERLILLFLMHLVDVIIIKDTTYPRKKRKK